tara:strand:+ start:1032 stop:1367 length:336 start_codon:yes stop_codon:yes gene_type:complete
MLYGVLLFMLANILAWFQFNSQFVWSWFQDKPVITCAIFSLPMSILFWHAIKYIVDDTGELWTSKLVGFGVSNIIFGIMTWFFLNESMFSQKTLISLFLACLIIAIQIFWK